MLKEKIVNFEREHRIVPKVVGACSALSVASVAAFAAEGSMSEIDTVTTAMTSAIKEPQSYVNRFRQALPGSRVLNPYKS